MTIIYHQRNTFLDKSTWGDGPWQSEPDKTQWTDEATGFACMAVRHPTYGHWCGYVGVTEGHPAFEKPRNAVDVDVHGGLTFADVCQEGNEEHGICHIPQPGQPDRVWWLGFDCQHAFDYKPAYAAQYPIAYDAHYGEYRTLEYVEQVCADLAAQLASQAMGEH